MFFSSTKRNLFKQLEFLGFDPISIKEVLKTHKTFESALDALNSSANEKFVAELRAHNLPKKAIESLSSKFSNFEQALSYYYEYQANLDTLQSQLHEFGFETQYISHCISQLWDVEDCLKHLKPEERKERINPSMEIIENNEQNLRVSVRFNSRDSRMFQIDRNSIRGNFEDAFDELTGDLHRRSLRRRGIEPANQRPRIQPRENPLNVPVNRDPLDNQFELLNMPQLIEAAMNGDELVGLLVLRILTQLIPQQGLSDTELNNLKIFKYNYGEDVKNITCTICYDDFEPGREIIRLPCQHCFDSICIRTWLSNSNLCPLCKFNLKSDDNND